MKIKTKLIATIMSICLVCAVFAIGVFALKTANLKIGGDVTATGVNAEINTAKLTNGSTITNLSDVSITTAKTQSEIDSQMTNWTSLPISFDANATDIVLSFKIANISTGDNYIEIDYDYEFTNDDSNIEVIPSSTNNYILDPKATADAEDVYQDFSLKFSVFNKQLSVPTDTKLNITIRLIHTTPVDSSTLSWFNDDYPHEYDTPSTGEMVLGIDSFSGNVEIPAVLRVDDKNYKVSKFVYLMSPDDGYSVFDGCDNVVLHNSIKVIGHSIIPADNNIKIPVSVTEFEDWALANIGFNGDIEYVVPSHITTLSGRTFGSSTIAMLTIPSSVTSIGEGAFTYCESLVQIRNYSNVTLTSAHGISSNCVVLTDPNQEDAYFYQDGFLFIENNNGTLYLNSYKGTSKEVTLPNVGKSYKLVDNVFEGKDFTSVVIPDFITELPSGTFKNCKSLTSVSLSSNLIDIKYETFANCTKLKTITIPASVQTIYSGAFSGCSLTSAIFEDTEGWVDPQEEPYYYYDVSTPALGAEVLNSGSLIANID